MLKKSRINYKVKLFGISLLVISFILLAWGYMLQELNNYKQSAIQSFVRNQEILTDQVAESIRDRIMTLVDSGYSPEQAEAEAANEIISKAEASGSKYWFLYSNAGVIFEKNNEETRNLKGKSIADLVQYWKLKGGKDINEFEMMLKRQQSGSAIFSKNVDYGEEIVSVKYFAVGETGYYLGVSTKKQYVLSVGRVSEHILYLYIFAGAVSLAVLTLALLLCIAYVKHRKDNEESGKEIADKNLYIEELTNKLKLKTETANNASICDVLTKLYNQRFFYTMLSKLNIEYFKPICIAVVDINGLDRLNQIAGFSAGDDLLIKTSGILQQLCLDTDVVARTGNSEFSILMVSTDESQAYGITDNIRRQFTDLDYTDLTLSIGVAQMNNEDADVFSVLERARKNVNLEKLNDPNSSSYNIVAMLIKMLNAYSPEAVAHCIRLKEKAVELGRALGLSGPDLTRLAIASQLHDVGKIGIPDTILNKKEMLTVNEKNMIQKHPETGYEIVKLIPSLDEVAIDILQHHEYYNGTGYPKGLAGKDITLNARIINIIDSFDAMTNNRVYSRVKTKEEALKELRDKSNIQYDPDIVSVFIKIMEN